jgi:hypothetical protein
MLCMPNIASILKSEITRLAAKAVRQETEGLKKASAAYRSDIAALKRRVARIGAAGQETGKDTGSQDKSSTEDGWSSARLYGSAQQGLPNSDNDLGLSAAACGRLLGVSALVRLQMGKWQGAPKGETTTGYCDASHDGEAGSKCQVAGP